MKNLMLMLVWGMNTLMLQHLLDISSKLSVFIFLTGVIVLLGFWKKPYIRLAPTLVLVALLVWLSTIQASNDLD